VNVAWAAPAANGSAVTGYSVVVSAGGTVVSTTPVEAGTTSTTITGLTRATDYSVTVSATNAVGTSEASAASTVRTPAEAPTAVGAPVASVVTGTSVNVAWTAPADGGSAVTGYTVSVLQGGSLVKTVNATGTSVLVEGLTSGTTYTFTVAATNAAGTGAASAASTAVTTFAVASAPSAPTAALAGDTGIDVSWAAPSTTGGTPITGYTVTLSTGGSIVSSQNVSASTLTTSFSALLPGKSYTAQVTANNSVGSSAVSDASVPVTIPATAPAAPAAPQASVSGTDVTIAWAAPASTGGSAITGYVVTLMRGGAVVDTKTVGGDALSASFTGLDYSTSYSATVVAVNAVGSSEASVASGSVLTGGPTAAPETVVVDDDLSEESQNGLTLDPGTAPQGSSVTVGGLDAGEWYFVTAFSEPVQLGWFQASADGEIVVSLAGVETGAHRVAVQNIDGGLVGWAGVTVTAAETVAPVGGAAPITGSGSTTPTGAATRLPNTGLEVGGWIALSSILVLGGFAALMLRRGRRHGEAASAD
jgi:LPXTG-motif cell wall-anchored protein